MNRLKSLDVMRGLTVALMILVNNGGEHNYSFLEHSKWNGLTPCDLVFPFFLFMMGMSTFLSLKKTEFKPSAAIYRKIAKRTVLLFLIGLGINWFDMICNGGGLDFAHLRIWAVLQRIALCYGVVAMLAITLNHRYFIHTIIGLIVIYMGILVFGNGYAYDASINILAQVDRSIFGIDHLYHRSPVDPEGLLSTIPAIAHTMIGFLCCKYISIAGQTVESKIKVLKVAGIRTLPDRFRNQQAHLESQLRIRNLRIRILDIGHPGTVYRRKRCSYRFSCDRRQPEEAAERQHPDPGIARLWHEPTLSLCDE